MLQSLNRWFYWALALTVAVSGAVLTLWQHQIRPTEDVIKLDQAHFLISKQNHPPREITGTPRQLPDDWRDHADAIDTGWYLANLDLEVAPNRLWSIYIPSLEMTPAVFINGTAIGGDAAPTMPLDRYWNRPVLYNIPNGLLRPGQNLVAIRLQANGRWGRLTELYLAPQSALQGAYERRYFWRVTFLNVTLVGSLMLALFMGALGVARRDTIYSWFAGFTFTWHLQNVFILTVEVPYANYLWDFTVYVIIGLMVASAAVFTLRFIGQRYPRWEAFIKTTAITGPVVLLSFLLISEVTFNLIGSMIWMGMLLILGTYPAYLIVRTLLHEQNTELFFLTICFTLTLFLGVHDWLVTSGLGYRHNGLLMQFAAAPTLATFGAILVRRFILALRETEALNRDLEQRVADKALEIDASYRRNKELEDSQLLLRERERIMRDMHDGVGSQLIGMMGHLNRSDGRDETLARDLETALNDLRLVIDSLDDVDNDVVVALGLFRNRIQPQLDAANVTLEWQIEDLPPVPDLGPERVLHFMRILQEAVTNTVKHASASRIVVRTEPSCLMQGRECACVIVEDDGRGLPEGLGNASGRGLKNMRYRAEEADLILEVESQEAGGTKVRIGFPLR